MKKPSSFNSLQRKRLYEEVAEALKKAIFVGEYRVGDKLPSETELAEVFQVSRPVVREAIRFLEVTGMVTVKQGATGGAFVSGISSRILRENVMDLLILGNLSVRQLTETRAHIDPEIARLAADRADEEDLIELEKSVRLSQDQNSGMDFDEQVENNARFHRLLGRTSKNPFYSIIEDIIMDFTVGFVLTIQPDHEVLHDPYDHDEILRAIMAHNPVKAVTATQRHIEKIGAQMEALEAVFLSISRKRTIGGA
jgi:GntR family transcriptional repressor for pyruvate dehydrogenase complex